MASIKDRIAANPALQAARAARDLDALAAGLNAAPETAARSRFITVRGIMSGCKDGNAILDKLETIATTNSAVRRAVGFLNQEAGLDIGDPFTQKMIDMLTATSVTTSTTVTGTAVSGSTSATVPQLTKDEATQLKNLAMAPIYVTRDDVKAAMFNDNGTEK